MKHFWIEIYGDPSESKRFFTTIAWNVTNEAEALAKFETLREILDGDNLIGNHMDAGKVVPSKTLFRIKDCYGSYLNYLLQSSETFSHSIA